MASQFGVSSQASHPLDYSKSLTEQLSLIHKQIGLLEIKAKESQLLYPSQSQLIQHPTQTQYVQNPFDLSTKYSLQLMKNGLECQSLSETLPETARNCNLMTITQLSGKEATIHVESQSNIQRESKLQHPKRNTQKYNQWIKANPNSYSKHQNPTAVRSQNHQKAGYIRSKHEIGLAANVRRLKDSIIQARFEAEQAKRSLRDSKRKCSIETQKNRSLKKEAKQTQSLLAQLHRRLNQAELINRRQKHIIQKQQIEIKQLKTVISLRG